jgi:hypothetical protein
VLHHVLDEVLIEAYNKAVENGLDEEFIEILEMELAKRGAFFQPLNH